MCGDLWLRPLPPWVLAPSPKHWGWRGKVSQDRIGAPPQGSPWGFPVQNGAQRRGRPSGVAAHTLQLRGLGEAGRELCTRSHPSVTRGKGTAAALGTESPTLAMPGPLWGMPRPRPSA